VSDAAGDVTVTPPRRRPVTLEDAIASGGRWSEQSFNGGAVADSFDAIASAPSAPDEEYANALTIDDLVGIAGDLHAAGVDGPLVADIDEPGLVLGSMTADWLLRHAVDVDGGDDYIGMSNGMVRTFPDCDARKYVEGFVDLPRTLRDWLALTDDQRQPMYHSSFAPERPGVALEDIARRVLASIEVVSATVADTHTVGVRIDKE
jgi:hypothetical protein